MRGNSGLQFVVCNNAALRRFLLHMVVVLLTLIRKECFDLRVSRSQGPVATLEPLFVFVSCFFQCQKRTLK